MNERKFDLAMTGEIVAETDISVSPPGRPLRDGRTKVMRLPEKHVWRGAHLDSTIYLPASSIRGALRNGAARALAAGKAARGKHMTPDDFLLVAKGGVKERKKDGGEERKVDYEAIAERRREYPVVSLFGSMAEKIAGRWQIGDAVPAKPIQPNRKGRGVRSHPFQRQPELAGFMDEEAYKAFLESDSKIVAANLDEDEAEKIDERVDREKGAPEPDNDEIARLEAESRALKEKVKALRKEAGGAVNIQQPLGGWQAIPEGTRMTHRMRLRGVTGDELAWAFLALRLLAREGRLGAHESHGEGYFRAEYALRLAVDSGDFAPAGTLRIGDFDVQIEGANPEIEAARERSGSVLDETAGNPE